MKDSAANLVLRLATGAGAALLLLTVQPAATSSFFYDSETMRAGMTGAGPDACTDCVRTPVRSKSGTPAPKPGATTPAAPVTPEQPTPAAPAAPAPAPEPKPSAPAPAPPEPAPAPAPEPAPAPVPAPPPVTPEEPKPEQPATDTVPQPTAP